MSHLDRLRGEVAAQAGLPREAVKFIGGETVAEMEDSATRLAGLLGTQARTGEPRAVDPVAGLFTAGASVKAQHSRRLLESLHGIPARQPRDAVGRFRSGGMDGGARPLPPAKPPSHDQLLGRLLAARQADRAR
jgi:hypothetical protein